MQQPAFCAFLQIPRPGKKPAKKPYTVIGNDLVAGGQLDPERLLNREQIQELLTESRDNGYSFHPAISLLENGLRLPSGNYLMCLDVDNCFDSNGDWLTSEMEQSGKALYNLTQNTLWEYSVSGTGLHLFIETDAAVNAGGLTYQNLTVECFSAGKAIVLTTAFDAMASILSGKETLPFIPYQTLRQHIKCDWKVNLFNRSRTRLSLNPDYELTVEDKEMMNLCQIPYWVAKNLACMDVDHYEDWLNLMFITHREITYNRYGEEIEVDPDGLIAYADYLSQKSDAYTEEGFKTLSEYLQKCRMKGKPLTYGSLVHALKEINGEF